MFKFNFQSTALLLCSTLLLQTGLSVAQTLDDMISPITNPVNFEDPRINSEARFIFIHHEIDDDFITGGGDVQAYALQLRFALTDDLALIATKDGWVDFNPDSTLTDESGFANVAAGLKYAFYQDNAAGEILTAGLRYEFPVGDDDVFFGDGDGFANPFLSAAKSFDKLNIMAGTGLRVAMDSEDSTFYDADLHFDYNLGGFYPTVEFNLVHVVDAGSRLPIADEGLDIFSFGSTESEGKTVVTAGFGGRVRISEDLDFGAAYQIPLTNGQGSQLIDWRVTSDLIYSF